MRWLALLLLLFPGISHAQLWPDASVGGCIPFCVGLVAQVNAGSGASSITASPDVPANSVVIVAVAPMRTLSPATVSTLTSAHLTFTKLAGASRSSPGVDAEIWWAPATSALSAETITANLSQSVSLGVEMYVVFVQGAYSINSPFDNNLNATKALAGSPTLTLTQSTTNKRDFLIWFSTQNSSTDHALPTGFTQIASFSSAPQSSGSAVGYLVKDVATSSVNYSAAVSGSSGEAAVMTAITADPALLVGGSGKVMRQPLTHW